MDLCGLVVKPLTYSKAIIGNDTYCELVGRTLKDLGLNRAFHLPTHHQPKFKGQNKPSDLCVQQVLNKPLLKLRHRIHRN